MSNNDSVIAISRLSQLRTASELLQLVFNTPKIEDVELPIDPISILTRFERVKLKKDLSFEHWDKSGFIKVNRDLDGTFCDISVWLNPSEVEVRQRFTAAHEIGHLIYDVVPNIDNENIADYVVDTLHRKTGQSDYKEVRANRFAAQLLMPKPLVAKAVSNLVKDYRDKFDKKIPLEEAIKSLSEKFGISTQSMEIRLKTLNFIKR